MKLVNPLKATKSFLLEPLKFYYDILRGLGALRIEDIDSDDEKTIIVNDYFENLYCLEIAGAGENVGFLPESLINTLSSQYAEDEKGEITWVLIKDAVYRKNLIFTRNKKIAEDIESATISTMLTFDEIISRILSLYFTNEYTIDLYRRELKQKFDIELGEEFVNPLNKVNNLIKERVNYNYNHVKYYQAISYKNEKKAEEEKFNIVKFFGVNFKGALFTKISFSKKNIKDVLEHQKFNSSIAQFSSRDKKHIKTLISKIDNQDYLMMNSTLLVFDDFGKNISSLMEEYASCKFDLVSRDSRDINNKTPILNENKNFSRVVKKDFLYKYITYNSKLDSDSPHIVGTNQDGSYINFGFKKATARNEIPKQHTILLGTSGSGKTQAANDLLKMLIGYDYENKKICHLGETNHVIFDIKDSFYHLVKRLKKEFPSKVDLNNFDKNEFVYNIVECEIINNNGRKTVDETDLDFASTLVSLILSSGEGTNESLTNRESEEFKSAIREVYDKNQFDRQPISSIRLTHPEEYKEIRDLGYREHTPFDTIKEKGYEKFKKPLLHNVLNVLKSRQQRNQLKDKRIEIELTEMLISKLESVQKKQIFSNYSKLNFKKKDIVYFRTDSIVGGEDYGYLVFAMQAIISKQIKKTQHEKRLRNKKRPLVFFWYEEARNIFANKLFKEQEVFERVINEWRSYNMLVFPVTQFPEHIPDSILKGFEIKMILTSGEDEDEKKKLIEGLSSRLAIGEQRKRILKELPKYTMLFLYGDGAFTFKFKDDPKFREIVNT